MASQAAELKMPQSGNVQREPSMEEILASIRRIIEDSDQVRKPEVDAAPARNEHAAARDVEAFREELRETEEPEAAKVSAMEDRPASDADSTPEEPDMELSAMPEQPVEPAPFMKAPEAREAVPEAFDGEEDFDLASDLLADAHDDLSLPPEAANSGGAASKQDEHPAEKPSIISEHTGRQVAAAFGELSQVFMASRQRSFDEMAAEMMRPMLQEWLDNNLPTIVEKLVREEIERVARGA